MEFDVNETKGLKVGNWVESSYLKGYFKIYGIKRGYRDGKDIGNILLLKKAFTGAMKFSFSAEKCHVAWCEKLSESKAREIETLLGENPTKKKKFDDMPPLFPCIQDMYFLSIDQAQAEGIRETLKGLPRYFTEERFGEFIRSSGLEKYIDPQPKDPKSAITLTIYTQEWMTDNGGRMLFCNPTLGNMWGKLAKLDDKEWSDYPGI